jgi:hypothetical protein
MGRRSALIALATSILVGLACPDLTWSQDAAETAYEGTQEAGGPVRLIVSGDGARIVLFEAEGVAGGGCSWDTITLQNWGDAIEIVEGAFAVTNADGDVLDGSRIAGPGGPPRIEGTIKVHDPVKGCETPSLRWVATAANP